MATDDDVGGLQPEGSLGDLVRGFRHRVLLTQEQLADKAGLSVRTVRGLETGDIRRPHRESLRLLADALGLDGEERGALESLAAAAPWRAAGGSGPASGRPAAVAVVPSQLPAVVADFTGRGSVVAELTALLVPRPGGHLRIVAVAGRGGVGKTTLALRVAHQVRGAYADGQLHVALGAGDRRPLAPADVVGRFLRALGVHGGAVPAGLDERVALYRSLLADRRVLVVLDDAVDEAQVRPLLPGGAGCAVLVTSRSRLPGLEGAHHHRLGALDGEEALALLASVAGAGRVLAERDAAEAVVGYCGCLPLAVRIAGARLAGSPHRSVGWLADRLVDGRRRLDELRAGDLEVRASAAVSYHALDPETASAFRLLGLLAAANVASWTVAALLDADIDRAELLLDRLVHAQLVDVTGPDATGTVRYRFHDLLRDYARERADAEEDPQRCTAAIVRAAGAWLDLADSADRAAPDIASRFAFGQARRQPVPPELRDQLVSDPLMWFEVERHAIVATVLQVAELDEAELAWELSHRLDTFFTIRSRSDGWRASHDAALEACRRAGNRRGEAVMLLDLSSALDVAPMDQRVRLLEEALVIFRDMANVPGAVSTLNELAGAAEWLGDREAMSIWAEEALALAQEGMAGVVAGDRNAYACLLLDGARSLVRLGRRAEARRSLDRALIVTRDLGARRAEAQVMRQLALVWRDSGDHSEAERLLQRGLVVVLDLGDEIGQARIQLDLGALYGEMDRPLEARAALGRAAQVGGEIGAGLYRQRALEILATLPDG